MLCFAGCRWASTLRASTLRAWTLWCSPRPVRATVEWVGNALSARLGLPCTVAYASAAPPLPGAAVDLLRAAGFRRVGVAAYFLAPGYLYDLAAASARAAGAVAVAGPLTDAPELVRLVAARVDEVASHTSAAA
jgi:sirohydrochlorin ferrochelatase